MALLSGPIAGQIAKERGQIQALRVQYGHRLTREDCVRGGHTAGGSTVNGLISGRRHYENKTGMFGRTPEQISEDSRKGGLATARKNFATGSHARWHIRRGITNPACKFCNPAAARARMNHAVLAAEYEPEDTDLWFKHYLERTR